VRTGSQEAGARAVAPDTDIEPADYTPELNFAFHQSGATDRITGPGIANWERRRIGYPAGAQAGQAGNGPTRVA